jgi:hypothetical protein
MHYLFSLGAIFRERSYRPRPRRGGYRLKRKLRITENGGDEGTRTLDLWRDRPAF